MGKLYPVGVQNSEGMIHDGYVYVDKTALIYQLFNTNKYYLLSRPRRFGKSLLLSTNEAYAQGKKELFKGLALEKLEKDWTVYPVLHLDLNTQKYDSPVSLTGILNDNLCIWENKYGARESETSLSLRFVSREFFHLTLHPFTTLYPCGVQREGYPSPVLHGMVHGLISGL